MKMKTVVTTFMTTPIVDALYHHPGRDVAGFNAVYQEFVEAPYPARTTVGSFLGDFLVEIDVVAALPACP